MYLRIDQNEIRVRISKIEAEALARHEKISKNCLFSENFKLTYSLEAVSSNNFLEYNEDRSHLTLKVNLEELQSQLNSRPTKAGIVFTQKVGHHNIKASLEIDIKKLKR